MKALILDKPQGSALTLSKESQMCIWQPQRKQLFIDVANLMQKLYFNINLVFRKLLWTHRSHI
jgi:hypothetical protein